MIELLSQNTIDKIAAGEVIERPAAVVKELLENAIDSSANAITVEIKNGGLSFLRITDNGTGIHKEELPLAFARHATSKIKKVEDLFTVQSLGFRGEALSSIAAVSQVECITKTSESLQGSRYEIHGGKEITLEEIGCPNGTTFIVRNLFYNTPARQKFLKSERTEGGFINDLVERFSLSHPNISFKFIVDGKSKLQTSGNDNCKNNIYYIYGSDITKALLEVDAEADGMILTGYIAKPEVSRGNRSYMNYFINGRYIKSQIISSSIENAYKNYTMNHRYPFTTLFLTIDSRQLDVNVHPTKMEVRFQNQEAVYQLINKSIRDVLAKSSLIPSVTLNSTGVEKKASEKSAEKIVNPPAPEPFEEIRKENISITPPPIREMVREESPFRFEQSALQTETMEAENKVHFRIIGQVFATYWLIEYKEELLIIDQHAAHEKVLYEKLLQSIQKDTIFSQSLAVPIIVTLSPREQDILHENIGILQKLGFVIESFGGKEYAIKEVPSDFLRLQVKELFIDLLDELMDISQTKSAPLETTIILEKCASMACKAAVKGNQTLSLHEADKLIEQMLLLENPYHCPHGRPTTISMTRAEFEKKFKRV